MIKRLSTLAVGVALTVCSLTSAVAQSMATAAPMSGGMMSGGMEHGMPAGKAGGDGVTYTGAPDLQAAISLVTAGGPAGNFSIVKALTALAGAKTANAEVAKLTKQYGKAKVASFVAVQNFAVNDAVKIATAAGVTFPKPMLTGAALAKRVVGLGLVDGTYYEGTQLDHLVTHKIHEQVMDDIDQKFGAAADGNYHRIADQAHYDLAQALGVTSVMLAAYH
ncbi:MAG TPA: hypothetical protein VHT05_05685 [Candidatus Elarobacter sp.]|nr:hypothetical protein [Candidatus Elarobacter sp.]